MKTGKIIPCAHCGKKMYKQPYQWNTRRKMFCSNKCKYECGPDSITSEKLKQISVVNSERFKGKIKGTTIPLPKKTCIVCGKSFQKQPRLSHKAWSTTKYCSFKCYRIDTKGDIKICPSCSKEFKISKSNTRRIYCSRTCFKKEQDKNSLKTLRERIYQVRGKVCERCNTTKNLILHHNDYLCTNEYNINNYKILCRKCHAKLHSEQNDQERKFVGRNEIKRAVLNILEALHIDKNDKNFKNTPARVARAYEEMCEGLYKKDEIDDILNTKFPTDSKDMVVTQNIVVFSMCPHHLMPVEYNISVGLIYEKDCIGLSKIPRFIELMAKRPILQEQLTHEIIDVLDKKLKLQGGICIIRGVHSCMTCRGIKAVGTSVITSAVCGCFLKTKPGENPKEEFFGLLKMGGR